MGTAGSERRKRWRHKACRRLQARAALRNVAETLKQARRDPSDESLERLRGALLMIERAAAASPTLDAAAQNCAQGLRLGAVPARAGAGGHGDSAAPLPRRALPPRRRRAAVRHCETGRDQVREGLRRRVRRCTAGGPLPRRGEAPWPRTARSGRPHSYDDETSGFFSYVHSLDEEGVVVEAARRFAKLFARAVPAIAEATGIEWWTHRRPHGAGHQLHFDSADEGAGADGPEHPLCSVVLYLSEARRAGRRS